jgi:CRP-like cAMP-binding protein
MVVVAVHLLNEDAGSQSEGPDRHWLVAPPVVSARAGTDQGSLWIRHPEPTFRARDIIFAQGDLGDSVYVIEEGECEVLCERKGEQELLATLSGGECFGEMALLSDRTRSATIRARTTLKVLIIPKADFNKLRQSVPAFGNVFTELVKQRGEVTGSPLSSVAPNMAGGPIAIPTSERELGPSPGFLPREVP